MSINIGKSYSRLVKWIPHDPGDIVNSTNTISVELYKRDLDLNPNLAKQDIVGSSVGILGAVSMLTFGAKGNKTENDLRKDLKIPLVGRYGALYLYKILLDKFSVLEDDNLGLRNKIFYRAEYRISSEFRVAMKTSFHSEAQSLHIDDPVTTAKKINDWFRLDPSTGEYVISPNNLRKTPSVILCSHAQFKGQWSSPFQTDTMEFWVKATQRRMTVPSMSSTDYFNYGYLREVKAKFVEIPCKIVASSEHKVSMFVILPDGANGLEELQNNINLITMDQLCRKNKIEVFVKLPTFKITGLDRIEGITNESLSNVFTNAAKVDKVMIMDCFDIIVEAGATSQPSTGVKTAYETFIANHPFMIIIATTDKHPLILFMVQYGNPQEKQ